MPEVTSIGGFAFSECKTLKILDMPIVESIEECTFLDCHFLGEIHTNNPDIVPEIFTLLQNTGINQSVAIFVGEEHVATYPELR